MPSSPHLLVRAARGESIERVPVWAMRQAGRWDPQFNAVRAGMPFFEFSEDVERALQGTLCPRRFGVDGIILFYDITTLPIAMGLPFELLKDIGPQPDRPIRIPSDLNRLNPKPPPSSYDHIRRLLARTKQELKGELPVIVFAGSPFTVATYCIGTGKDITATHEFASRQSETWYGLLDKLTEATGHFLRTLIADGADVYQLFDSWAGMLNPEDYDRWAQSRHRTIFAEATGVPRILFVKECPYLDSMAKTGADVISLGKRHDLAVARELYPYLTFQGNVDEEILRKGTPEQVEAAVKACLRAGGGRRHILNLNHGVGKETPVANFEAYIRAAKAGP